MATGNSIIARARTIASQTAGDANTSAVIDARGGLRVLLNNAIREVYRQKANDKKFRQDISVENAVSVSAGTAAVPENLMREFLPQANISNSDGDLISFMTFPVDVTESFNQLGYVWLTGDTLNYRAPSPTLGTYSGTLTVSCPSYPEFPASMATEIPFPSTATVDDVVLALAAAITGNLDWSTMDEKKRER
jgi:hypothetical protein